MQGNVLKKRNKAQLIEIILVFRLKMSHPMNHNHISA